MKRIILFYALVCTVWSISAQSHKDIASVDSLATRVERFGTGLPQEKVYLHIDNTCYFVGDTIWYKAYVTRSDKWWLTDLSKIMYVELLTPDGYLVERQQLKMEDGTAHGAFTLTDSLYAGYYELRAYTRWMLNFGRHEHPHSKYTEDMFYNKQMAKDFFRDYDKLYSRVFPVFDHPKEAWRYAKDMTLRPMRRYKARKGKPEIDLRFYPEGGHLIEGTDGHVAFEINDEEGKHLEAELSIIDSDGKEVAQTRTLNRGRGVFTLTDMKPDDKYKARLHYQDYDYEVKLPEVEKEGYALHVERKDSVLRMIIQGTTESKEELGIQIQCNGVSKAFRKLSPADMRKDTVDIFWASLPTGVNQITVFNGEGRIYADRLFFVNHHDYDQPLINVEGIKQEYATFEPIELRMKLLRHHDADVSLAIRDHATDETTYDNGTMLTEMLLASEIKGFVENPGWYFEADDSLHRHALDLLMMVQGWRRHDWRMMAGLEHTQFEFLPEKIQTLSGSVHQTYSLLEETDYGDSVYIPFIDSSVPIYTTARDYHLYPDMYAPMAKVLTLQDLYGPLIKEMKKEVNVSASFIQDRDIVDVSQTTQKGKFYMPSAVVNDNYILFLSASDSTKSEKYKRRIKRKGFMDEQAYPEFYVKLDPFFPVFPKPYSYYQDAAFEEKFALQDSASRESFTERKLNTVTVRSKRGGLRRLDHSKPALVVDAYEAFNLAADYGLNCGMHDWRTFSRQVATAFFGDMGMDRHFYLQEQYDGKILDFMPEQKRESKVGMSMSNAQMEKYRRLRHLDKLYIYTDYVPREQGSWKYSQTNQPEVVIDYRLLPNDGVRPTYRDRRYAAKGYSVCTEFYCPDYSKKPMPDVKDYRRTLYWTPKVKFNDKGEAVIQLYNNSKKTVITVEAEGITTDGKPVVWKSETDKTYSR